MSGLNQTVVQNQQGNWFIYNIRFSHQFIGLQGFPSQQKLPSESKKHKQNKALQKKKKVT